jgi:Flp pilus assembly protein TadG
VLPPPANALGGRRRTPFRVPAPMTSPIRFRDESGTALVEFAFVLPMLLVLVLGIADFGRAFNYWIDSTHLANVAARYAAVNKNPGAAGSLTLQRYMELQASTKELRNGSSQQTPVDVCVSFPAGTSNVGDPVKVEVKSTWSWLHYLVGRTHITSTTLKGSATMRLEANRTNYSAGCA